MSGPSHSHSHNHHGRYDSDREDRDDHHDSCGSDRDEQGDRHRSPFDRRVFSQLMGGIRDAGQEVVREVVGSGRQERRHPRLQARPWSSRQVQQSQSRAAGNEKMVAMREFQRLNPPAFSGDESETDPLRAKEWLERITQILDILGIENSEQRVSLAVFQLQDSAYHWWRFVSQSVGDNWEEFEKAFLNNYMPDSAMDRLWWQFEKLTQGSMTVDQYAKQFINLSRYATDLVANEERKCRRFEKGLRPAIRYRVAALRFCVFADLLESARAVEENWELTQKERKSRKSKGASTSRDDRQAKKQKSPSLESDPEILCRSGSVGLASGGLERSFDRGPVSCYLCDQPGHKMSKCPMMNQARASISYSQPQPRGLEDTGSSRGDSIICFRCNQPGHVAKFCYYDI